MKHYIVRDIEKELGDVTVIIGVSNAVLPNVEKIGRSGSVEDKFDSTVKFLQIGFQISTKIAFKFKINLMMKTAVTIENLLSLCNKIMYNKLP